MPIRHTDKGWYWGGQGPFSTKAKALSVARAAYAAGYREQQGDTMNHEPCKQLLATLMCGQIVLRLIHWNTTSYAEHKAIGKLYDELADLTDSVAEVYMGIYGRVGAIPCNPNTDTVPDAAQYVGDMAEVVQALRPELPNDTQLQNLIDEVAAAIDRTNYLLTLK